MTIKSTDDRLAAFRVRFRSPVFSGQEAAVKGWVTSCSPPLFVTKAVIIQDSRIKTVAAGKFMEQPQPRNKRYSHFINKEKDRWQGEQGKAESPGLKMMSDT